MIKVTYEYNGEIVEEFCETCLEVNVLEDSLKSNPQVSNIKVIYD